MFSEIDSLISIIARLFKLSKRSHVQLSVDRFKQLFLEHDYAIGQLPSLLPDNLKQSMHAFGSDESITANLTDELISWVSHAFGIRREWLEGADKALYEPTLYGYKNIDGLFKKLNELEIINAYTPLYIFTSGSLSESSHAKLWAAFAVPFDPSSEGDDHVRYIPLSDQWTWNYDNSRNHLVHIANQFYENGGNSTPVYKVPALTMERMHRREVIPNVRHLKRCNFYAESLG